jgi:hypothetical protein
LEKWLEADRIPLMNAVELVSMSAAKLFRLISIPLTIGLVKMLDAGCHEVPRKLALIDS